MYIVAIAWVYVVVMMAAAEALSPNGSLLGAFFTLLLYGVLPLSIVLYLMATPARRRRRAQAERAAEAAPSLDPDPGRHAPGDAVAPERKES
jgi:membrane protein implicated in regulation of membrane protease activity